MSRPLGTQLIAERPGEILMADYIKMGDNSRAGYQYVLMLADKMTRKVRFLPSDKTTAIHAAHSIIVGWAAQNDLPDWLISDGGSQ